MSARPGPSLAQRPLHFFVIADCSGSMASQGKIQSLNVAMRETIPHLVDVARQNPHAKVLLRAVAFSTHAWWHIEEPTPVEELRWTDLQAGGYTDLGTALNLVTGQVKSPPMPERALPPAMVLVSDGRPTDDYRSALRSLLEEPWGQRAARMSVGIGRDADRTMLQEFMGAGSAQPLSAHNPEQLIRMLRWATIQAGRAATNLPPVTDAPMWQPVAADINAPTTW